MKQIMKSKRWQIAIGLGSCGLAAGAMQLYEQVKKCIDPGKIDLKKTGCVGMCYLEPILELTSPKGEHWTYVNLTPDAIIQILDQHILHDKPVQQLLLSEPERLKAANRYLSKQVKIVLENCGCIDPESVDDYIAVDGYKALESVLHNMKPADVIAEITASGLRGRGGAGFPTGLKWKFAAEAPGEIKYMICNGDEGDPGAFMDRSVLEGDPHRVIEGILIAGYATGAEEGYIYVRSEYPLAVKRLNLAIEQAQQKGFLGKRIFDSPFSFTLQVREGAGAFVCGEETALIQSIEGKRAIPSIRPPFPAQKGLWGRPTVINNVETLANIPWIIRHSAKTFAAIGTEKSAGTKVFALAGKVKRAGLVEVPMGITLREIVEEIGGGSISGKPVKAVQIGGPSGGCIPESEFHTRIDYDEVQKTGAIMGSGGLIVIDESACMVDIAKFFLSFTTNESCGKCTFCRIGTQRMLELLTRITEGQGTDSDLELLEKLAVKVKETSLCGLGQTAPNPVLTTLRYFRQEYETHIRQKKCPAKVCKALITYSIDPNTCTGCTACVRVCPAGAITGEKKQAHHIDQQRCTRCGACFETCKFEAIKVQ